MQRLTTLAGMGGDMSCCSLCSVLSQLTNRATLKGQASTSWSSLMDSLMWASVVLSLLPGRGESTEFASHCGSMWVGVTTIKGGRAHIWARDSLLCPQVLH
jgi:hypothetical protein